MDLEHHKEALEHWSDDDDDDGDGDDDDGVEDEAGGGAPKSCLWFQFNFWEESDHDGRIARTTLPDDDEQE